MYICTHTQMRAAVHEFEAGSSAHSVGVGTRLKIKCRKLLCVPLCVVDVVGPHLDALHTRAYTLNVYYSIYLNVCGSMCVCTIMCGHEYSGERMHIIRQRQQQQQRAAASKLWARCHRRAAADWRCGGRQRRPVRRVCVCLCVHCLRKPNLRSHALKCRHRTAHTHIVHTA